MKRSLYTQCCTKIFSSLFSKYTTDQLIEKNVILAKADIQKSFEAYCSIATMNVFLGAFISFLSLEFFYLLLEPSFPFTFVIFLPLFVALIIVMYYLYLPKYKIKKRGRNIDIFLPYAVNFISSMAVAGISPAEIFQSLSAIDVYGEIQKEAKRIAKDITVLGTDSITAMKNAIEISPSKKFRSFLQGVIGTIQSGSDLHLYLSTIAEKYMQDDLLERKKDLDLLGIIGEVFVISVIAFPIFLVIILTTMGFFGGSMTLSLLILFIFSVLVLPIIYAGFYFLIKSTSLEEITKLKLVRKNTQAIYEKNRYASLSIFGLSIILVIFAFTSMFIATSFKIITPSIYLYADLIFISIIIIIGPFGIHKYFDMKKKKQIQARLPEFLIEIGDSLSTGMTIFDAIKAAEKGHYGELKPEIEQMKNKLSWNVSIKDVFNDFATKMKSAIIQRIVITINKGVIMGGSTPRIFKAAAREVNQVNQLEDQRKTSMSIYTIVIMLCFFVFLAIIIILEKTIFSSFIDLHHNQLSSFSNVITVQSVDAKSLKYALYSFVFVQSIGAGLLGGFMMDGRLSSGVRYSCILGLVSFFMFKFLF